MQLVRLFSSSSTQCEIVGCDRTLDVENIVLELRAYHTKKACGYTTLKTYKGNIMG